MKVTLERLPESRVQLDIEVDDDRVERSLDATYKRLASRSKIPGFRPGKAPRAIVERMFGGRRGLIYEARESIITEAYNHALESEHVKAIAQPDDVNIQELEPFRFTASVPVRPSVDLGDYQSIGVPRDPVEVTDEMVEEQVLLLRRRHATQSPVERAANWDDTVIADVSGGVEDEQFLSDTDAEFALRRDVTLFIPGLSQAFVGMAPGEQKSITLEMPEDFRVERHRGKPATFTLTLKEVKEEILPEPDDELAASVSAEEFPTFEALKERIRSDLTTALTEQAEARQQAAAVDLLVEGATIEYPRVLVEREIDHALQETMGSDQQAYFAYLARVGRSEAELRETFRELAETRVRRALVVDWLGEAEGVAVSDEEVEEELNRLVAPMGPDAGRLRELLSSEAGRDRTRRTLLSRKTLERLVAIASAAATEESA